jgi:GNAT superfamily N-acetyltransferase
MDNNSSDLVYTIVTNQNGDISAADKRLLRQAYDDVYLPAFPEPEEQISFRKLCTDVKNSATVTLICAPGSLKPVIKALAIGYHYHGDASGPDVGLLGYLATDPHYQGQGLGKKMDALFRQAALEKTMSWTPPRALPCIKNGVLLNRLSSTSGRR